MQRGELFPQILANLAIQRSGVSESRAGAECDKCSGAKIKQRRDGVTNHATRRVQLLYLHVVLVD